MSPNNKSTSGYSQNDGLCAQPSLCERYTSSQESSSQHWAEAEGPDHTGTLSWDSTLCSPKQRTEQEKGSERPNIIPKRKTDTCARNLPDIM